MTRRYYAEECPYGLTTMSDGDTCFVFESCMERDYFVSECDMNRAAISRDEARRRYNFNTNQLDKPDYKLCGAVDGYAVK